MTRFIISITSKDRSGIIAGISEGICRLSGNIEAASQTVHRGYFAMILLVGFEASPASDEVSTSLKEAAGSDLHVYSIPYDPEPREAGPSDSTFVVTCMGPDKPGILRTLTRFLASRNVNIDDLYCTVADGSFVAICQVTIPDTVDLLVLQTDLKTVAGDGGFTSTLQHEGIFEETNRP
ncbi:MAG: hypothetical protein KAU31_08905 [Spirochaetaceae bacterium]|nr:hypothetical protein [Spirochaetaceae bacterium]